MKSSSLILKLIFSALIANCLSSATLVTAPEFVFWGCSKLFDCNVICNAQILSSSSHLSVRLIGGWVGGFAVLLPLLKPNSLTHILRTFSAGPLVTSYVSPWEGVTVVRFIFHALLANIAEAKLASGKTSDAKKLFHNRIMFLEIRLSFWSWHVISSISLVECSTCLECWPLIILHDWWY